MNKQPNNEPYSYIASADFPFVKSVLPHGLQVSASYFKCGDTFVTTLIAHRFPAYIEDLVFADLFSMNGVTATLDVKHTEKKQIKRDIKNSIDEISSRASVERSAAEFNENQYEQTDMEELQAAVSRSNEQIVSATIRLIVAGKSLEELEINVSAVREKAEDFGIDLMIPRYELESEYRALQSASNTMEQPVPVHQTLSRQFPFYYQNLIDPLGAYFGYTMTGGQVILDTFREVKDGIPRNSFDILLIGTKGSGKSATLKAMLQDRIILGDKFLALDIEGEFRGIAMKLGGKIINPAQKGNFINPLHLRQSVTIGMDGETTESNFASEISRIETFMFQYVPNMDFLDAEELKDILGLLYAKFGIRPETDISKLKATEFPLLSDLLSLIREKLYIEFNRETGGITRGSLSQIKMDSLIRLESYVKQLAEGVYAPLFNGHSTVDVQNEQLVIFDLSTISNMDERVFDAYIFNILMIMWNEVCKNRILNRDLKNQLDRRYVINSIDEAHRFLNVNHQKVLEFMGNLLRRSRKYDAALWLTDQSAREYIPDSSGSVLSDRIKTIFELVQYKMILQQDSSSVHILSKLFPGLTDSELSGVSSFRKGEMIITFGGDKAKLHCFRDIPQEDFAYFRGGRE